MAILEINLEKPALVEERRYPGASESEAERQPSDDSGGGRGKLLGLLVVLAGVAALAWKLKSGGSEYEHEEAYEHGPEPEIGGDDGMRSKVAGVVGLAVALVSLVAAVRRVRS